MTVGMFHLEASAETVFPKALGLWRQGEVFAVLPQSRLTRRFAFRIFANIKSHCGKGNVSRASPEC